MEPITGIGKRLFRVGGRLQPCWPSHDFCVNLQICGRVNMYDSKFPFKVLRGFLHGAIFLWAFRLTSREAFRMSPLGPPPRTVTKCGAIVNTSETARTLEPAILKGESESRGWKYARFRIPCPGSIWFPAKSLCGFGCIHDRTLTLLTEADS